MDKEDSVSHNSLNREVFYSGITYYFSSYYYTGFILLLILDKSLKTAATVFYSTATQ